MTVAACAEIVRKGDPDRFYAALLAPMPERGYLFALHAFNLEIARAPWLTQERLIAEMRLQWWRDALDEIFSGGPVRQHEVAAPLAEAIGAARLPRTPFEMMIDARQTDIERAPMTPDEAFAYGDATAGNLMVLSVQALGLQGQSRHAARFLGQAQGAANLGAALPALYRSGWRVLDGWDGARLSKTGPSNALQGAVGSLGDMGQVALLKSIERREHLPRKANPATLAAWATPRILKVMVHPTGRGRVFSRSFETSDFRRKSAILIRNLKK